MNHTPPIIIENKNKTVAYYSSSTPNNLILFVHGFSGKSTGTWNDFPSLIHEHNEFAHSDIIFYGYKSVRWQANYSAMSFKQFLLTHTQTNLPERTRLSNLNLPNNFSYNRIILVAHSLGAIVVRRAMLFVKGQYNSHPLLNNIRMVLFAPAHRGTLINDSLVSVLPNMVQIVATLGLLAVPVIKNLQPDSGTIQDLIIDTKIHRDNNEGDFTIARKVIWAEKEWVVCQDRFDPNEQPIIQTNTNHLSVCKPVNGTYDFPIEYVIQELI